MGWFSLSGLVGAVLGLGIGVLNFGVVASFIRKWAGAERSATVGRLMPALFVLNELAFAALGFWVGVSLPGV